MKGNKGVVDLIVLVYVAGALALTQLVPNWRVSKLFEKGPQTAQLRAAQDDAAKAKAELMAAQARLDAALAEQKATIVSATQHSQQLIAGVPAALARAQQSPEVVLASRLAKMASSGLAVAIGDLPADKQAEIVQIVEQALSAKQDEVDTANAALAEKEAELKVVAKEKKEIEAKIPMLENQAKVAETRAVAADVVVATKTNEVAIYAEKAAAKDKEAGSLGALLTKLLWVFGAFIALYLFVHFILPSLAQEFPAAKTLVTFNKAVKSVFSSHL